MSNRRLAVPAIVTSAFAILFFGLGSYLAARPSSDANEIAALRAEVDQLRRAQPPAPTGTSGTSAIVPAIAPAPAPGESRAAIVEDVKRQLQSEMGLFPVRLLRERREIQSGRRVPAGEFARALTPDLDSSYLGAAARSRLLRAALRTYWSAVLALLPG